MAGISTVEPSSQVTQFAEDNMWSQPYENQQFRLALQRVSPEEGFIEYFQYLYRPRQLPIGKTFFQVYTLGGIDQGYWNLIIQPNNRSPIETWFNLGDLCSKRGLHVDLYDDEGKLYPRRMAWVMKTKDGINLLAIERSQAMHLHVDTPFFLRCYTPDWDLYHSSEGTGDPSVSFQYSSIKTPTQSDLNALAQTYTQWSALPGITRIIVNGTIVTRLPYLSEVTFETIVEITYDPVAVKKDTYALSSLLDFYSDLDKKRKLIVHPPKDDTDWGFYSFDDCDFFVEVNGQTRYLGLNDISVIRQLTHRDYSVSQDGLLQLINSLGYTNLSQGNLVVVYHSTKLRYDLVFEKQRIHYLYKLTDSQILGAMTMVNASVPEWMATNLEASPTMQLDRAFWSGITRVSTYNALGYNGATKAFADSPLLMPYVNQTKYYPIPYVYQTYLIALEYDINGLYLGYYQLTRQSKYYPNNPNCNYVEFIPGIANRGYHLVDGIADVTLPTNVGYRVYECGFSIDTKQPDEKWVDITGTDNYTVTNGVLSYTFDKVNRFGRVIFNDHIFAINYSLKHLDNSMFFNFTDENVLGTLGVFAPANIYLILNGHPLIENIDYVLNYPECYIVNRQFMQDTNNQLMIFADGISPLQTQSFNQSELGFVIDGCIGYNGRYNVREDRRTRLVVGGRLILPSEIGDSESQGLIDTVSPFNGYPYGVKHIYQSLAGVVDQDYVDFDAGRATDLTVSQYLTKYYAKKDYVGSNLQDKYRVYSLFLHTVLNALKLGVITLPTLADGKRFSQQALNDATSAYQWILKFDPVTLNFDTRYFSIAPYATPSVIALKPTELLFITQLNETYLASKCGITGYFEVSNV